MADHDTHDHTGIPGVGGSTDLDAIIAASAGQDIADALSGAAAPDAGNVFATMADIGGGGGNFGTVERALVDPTGLSWSWVNQGGASVATSGATIYLSAPANASDDHHMRIKALANSKPYTEIFHITATFMPVDYSDILVGWLDSATNKFVGLVLLTNSATMHIASVKSNTNYIVTSTYVDLAGNYGDLWHWVALCDDSTNRRIWLSRDGNNWVLFHTVATDDFITPDRIVFGVNPRNTTWATGLLVDSVETHTGSTP